MKSILVFSKQKLPWSSWIQIPTPTLFLEWISNIDITFVTTCTCFPTNRVLNLLYICFYIVIFLVPFGNLFIIGLVSLPLILNIFQIILLTLLTQQTTLKHTVLFFLCGSFGSLVLGCYGMKETISYSKTRKNLLLSCWIK